MSGWLEFYESEISCPKCKKIFNIQFVEEGDIKEEPQVIISIAGGSVICPNCKFLIRDENLNNKE